jgi:hypothetical protein
MPILMNIIRLYIFEEPVDIMRVYFFTGIRPTGLRIIAEQVSLDPLVLS